MWGSKLKSVEQAHDDSNEVLNVDSNEALKDKTVQSGISKETFMWGVQQLFSKLKSEEQASLG